MNEKIIAVTLFAFASSVGAAQGYKGDAYDVDSGRLLYRVSHFLSRTDGTRERIVLYRCPDGRPFARKRVVDDGNAQAPDFSMRDARSGYREGVRRAGGKREVYVKRGGGREEKVAPLKLPEDGVIDAGFDVYVHRHWDALARGDTMHFSFLVPSKRKFYTFKLSRLDDASDARHLTLRLSLGAWYAFLAPHIDVLYDRTTRRLLRFSGLSNVRDPDLKNYKVRIEFPNPPHTVSRAGIDAARSVALVASCATMHASP